MKLPQLLLIGFLLSFSSMMNAQNNELQSNLFGDHTPETIHSSASNYRIIGIADDEYVEESWINMDSISYTYSGENGSDEINDEFYFDECKYFQWNENEFTPVQLLTRAYYADSLIGNQLAQNYADGEWVDNYNYLFNYNDDNQLTSNIYEIAVDGVWEDDSRVLYEYEGENLSEEIRQDWIDSSWQNNTRDLYTYYEDGLLESQIEQQWNGTSWENDSKRTFEYDENENVSQQTYELWTGTDWMPLYRSLFEYDDENWLVEEVEQTTAGGELPWQDGDRVLFSHNSGDFYYNEILYQNLVDGDYLDAELITYTFTEFNRVATSTSNSMWDDNAWQIINRSTFYYEEYDDGTIGVESINDLSVKVFPNPAADYVTFRNDSKSELMEVEIFNLSGQKVKSLKGTSEIRWNISRSLPAGVYSYVLSIGDKAKRGQIVNR